MKHYHGTPIGGKNADAASFCIGRFVLVPWKRADDLERAMECSRGFCVDNSAFSFWSSGEKPKWSEYAAWCSEICHHPRFEFALIPDVIDGTVEENNKLIDFWQRTMKDCPSCPVWHMHESLQRLVWLASNWERVAIGSSGEYSRPGSEAWHNRMADAFDAITLPSGYPIAKVHGLRMLQSEIVQRYPFSSCDSTNAVQNGSRLARRILTENHWGRVTNAIRIEYQQSPSVWIRREKQKNLFEILN